MIGFIGNDWIMRRVKGEIDKKWLLLLALLDPEVQRIARVLTGPGFRKKRQDKDDSGPRLVRRPE